MQYYCSIDSPGGISSTNLQLYSLEKASEEWNDLVCLINDFGEADIEHYKERLTFIISCLGLSLSQLLGQNHPSPYKEKMDNPSKLLSSFLHSSNISKSERKEIKNPAPKGPVLDSP